MAKDIIRVQVRLPISEYEKLKSWANKFGITMTQLGGMSVQAGLDGIIRAVSPFDSLTPEQWASITKEMDKGKIPNEEIIGK